MEFLKKNKKAFLIGFALIALFSIVWFVGKSKTDEVTPAAADPNKDKITAQMNRIRLDADWFKSITDGAVPAGLTINQSLANNAIWALKHDGIIPVNTYGNGEWGHLEYAKANY